MKTKALIKKTGALVTVWHVAEKDGKTICGILEDADRAIDSDEFDFINNTWAFIEKWLPGYCQNQDVALSDDIQCCLDAEAHSEKLRQVVESCGDTPEDWEREQIRIEHNLLVDACHNYFKEVYGRDACIIYKQNNDK